MSIQLLPQQLAVTLPIFVTMLAGWLGTWRLPTWANEVIVGLVLVVVVAIWAVMGGRLSNDLVADLLLVAGYSAALVAGPLAPLRQWLVINMPSPLHLVVKAPARLALPSPGKAPQASAASHGSEPTPLPSWVTEGTATTTKADETVAG